MKGPPMITKSGHEGKVRRWVTAREREGWRLSGPLQVTRLGNRFTATMEWPTPAPTAPLPVAQATAPCCGRVPLSAIGYNPANGRIECSGCSKLWVPEGYATSGR